MKTKKLKNLTKKARGELAWAVREIAAESVQLRIFSDPVEKTHTIYLPAAAAEEGPARELHYLHELGHALLCERVHPFFASGFPIAGLEKAQMAAAGPVLSAASDWFVGHWLMEFCPELARAELADEFAETAEMMAHGETPDLDRFFVAVLITAQSIKYLNKAVNCSGFLDAAVQAFLTVSPDAPTVEKLLALFNGLLSLGAPYRCRLVNSQGQDVLGFFLNAANGEPPADRG
jgi:hypothetical protein